MVIQQPAKLWASNRLPSSNLGLSAQNKKTPAGAGVFNAEKFD